MTPIDRTRTLPIDPAQNPPGKVAKKQIPPYYRMILVILPVFAGGLAIWAMLNLQSGSGFSDIAKAVMVGVVVGLVSYCINRFAVDWGTELAASGIVSAGIFSVLSMLAVGACLWAFTYAGIVLGDVRYLQLDNYGRALVLYIEAQNKQASKSKRIVPVIRAAKDDLFHHGECEARTSCLSGRGNGGRGPITRVLEEKAARGGDIAKQVEEGAQLHAATIARINKLVGDYQTVLDRGDQSIAKRRQELVRIDAHIGQAITALHEAMPVTLLSAYGGELKSGVNIPGRAKTTQAVNRLLAKHGTAITTVLATLDIVDTKRPQFPAKAGITTTFAYIGNFIAVAGVIWVAEGIFPLALWLYTFWFLIRLQDQAAQYSQSTQSAVATAARATLNGAGRGNCGQTSGNRKRRQAKNTRKNLNGGRHAN